MIPTPAECHWNETRPWSTSERILTNTLAAALARIPDMPDRPTRLARGAEPANPTTYAHRLLLGQS